MSDANTVSMGGITCRKPNLAEFERAMDKLEASKFKAMHALVLACRQEPDAETARAIIADKPGLVLQLGGKLMDLVMVDDEDVEGN